VQSQVAGELIIAGITFIVSVMTSAFIAGTRWGRVQADVTSMKSQLDQSATKTDVQSTAERLARIEGMFELRLRDGADGHRSQG
jgi:hypothetical protein